MTTIKTAEGVNEAGPDVPALAEATQREENGRRAAMEATTWPGAPVGAVSREQAGILPTGPMQVTDEMVYRAQTELVRHENPSGASAVRAALKAALTG